MCLCQPRIGGRQLIRRIGLPHPWVNNERGTGNGQAGPGTDWMLCPLFVSLPHPNYAAVDFII
jgi:hypothetical protein